MYFGFMMPSFPQILLDGQSLAVFLGGVVSPVLNFLALIGLLLTVEKQQRQLSLSEQQSSKIAFQFFRQQTLEELDLYEQEINLAHKELTSAKWHEQMGWSGLRNILKARSQFEVFCEALNGAARAILEWEKYTAVQGNTNSLSRIYWAKFGEKLRDIHDASDFDDLTEEAKEFYWRDKV